MFRLAMCQMLVEGGRPALSLEPAGDGEQFARMGGQSVQGFGKVVFLEVEGRQVVGEIAGVVHRLADQLMDAGGILRGMGPLFLQLKFQPFGHQGDPGELLAQVVMEIEADAAALLFGNFQ